MFLDNCQYLERTKEIKSQQAKKKNDREIKDIEKSLGLCYTIIMRT